MRLSRAFFPTLREAPSRGGSAGFQLLQRGGYLRVVGAGMVHLLPLGTRLVDRLEASLRDRLVALGAEAWDPAALFPGDSLRGAGRWATRPAELVTIADRQGRDLCWPQGSEEAVFELAVGLVRSYRQLPLALFSRRRRQRNSERARPGLFDLRDAPILDGVALDPDEGAARARREQLFAALCEPLRASGLPLLCGPAGALDRGGRAAQGAWVPHPDGRATLVVCDGCGAVHGRRLPRPRRNLPPKSLRPRCPMARVPTPDCTTIDEVATFLEVPTTATAKAVFLATDQDALIFAVVRGDCEVSEEKLARAVGARGLRPATSEEVASTGAVPGYASPVGITQGCEVLVDPKVATAAGLVAGANEPGFHLVDARFGRDYSGRVVDLAVAPTTDRCAACEGRLSSIPAALVARVLDLGEGPARAGMQVQFPEGPPRVPAASAFEVDLMAVLGCLAEARAEATPPPPWPMQVAPYEVEVLCMKSKDDACAEAASRMVTKLEHFGFTVAYDDRPVSPGAKFGDADLLGAPLLVLIGPRALKTQEAEIRDQVRGTRKDTAFRLVQERLRVIREGLLGG